MKLLFGPDKDTYITNKFVNGDRAVSSSLGYASTMDIYKLYGSTVVAETPQVELTRGMIHFDIAALKEMYLDGKLPIDDPSFKCSMVLKDVYGGQPTPLNFQMVAYPLSASFDEGYGKDVVAYADLDVANFLSGSIAGGAWLQEGCGLGLPTSSGPCDFFNDIQSTATVAGPEDVVFDVTVAVSATLAGVIPDQGFRVSLGQSEESDNLSYFVKRLSTRHAYDPLKRPRLYVEYEDYIIDCSNGLFAGKSSDIFLYNFTDDGPADVLSGTTPIVGSNCIILEMVPQFSGGMTSYFTASQYGSQIGFYSASVLLGDAATVAQVASKGYAKFTPYWKSLDLTVAYLTGSSLEVLQPAVSTPTQRTNYAVSVFGVPEVISRTESAQVRLNFFNPGLVVRSTRYHVDDKSSFVRRSQYGVRDVLTGEMVVDFGESTRASTDIDGSYFTLSGMSLVPSRTYVIDVKVIYPSGDSVIYKDVSSPFKVVP